MKFTKMQDAFSQVLTGVEFFINKFFKPKEHLIGSILYPLGQLALALSTLFLF